MHAESATWEDTDWHEVVALYDLLVQLWPSPVVQLNRAVALGFANGPEAGLAAIDALANEPQLAGYHYLPAARADHSGDSIALTRPARLTRKRCS